MNARKATMLALACVALLATSVAAAPQTAEAPYDATITVPELFDKARAAANLDRPALAEEYYKAILVRDPESLDAILELSALYEQTGKLETARGLLRRAERLAPGDPGVAERRARVEEHLAAALAREAETLMAMSRWDEAMPKLSLALSVDPGDAMAWYRRAWCHFELDHDDDAMLDLNKAMQIAEDARFETLRDLIDRRVEKQALARLRGGAHGGQTRPALPTPTPAVSQNDAGAPGDDSDSGLRKRVGAAVASVVRSAVAFAATHGGTAARWLGRVLDAHLPLWIALALVLALFRSPLTRVLIARARARPLLTGDLDKFSLPEVLLMLNSEMHSGVLAVQTPSGRGKIYLESGQLCHAVAGRREGLDAVRWLLADGERGSFSFDTDAMPIHHTIEKPLAVVLAELGRPSESRRVIPGKEPKKSRMKELLETRSR